VDAAEDQQLAGPFRIAELVHFDWPSLRRMADDPVPSQQVSGPPRRLGEGEEVAIDVRVRGRGHEEREGGDQREHQKGYARAVLRSPEPAKPPA